MYIELLIHLFATGAYLSLGIYHLVHRERLPGSCYVALATCGVAHALGM